MANHEAPKDVMSESLVVSDDELTQLVEEVRSAEFNRVCERLYDLGIEPNHPHLFNAFIDGEWTRLFANPVSISLPDGERFVGEQIVVNRFGYDQATEGQTAQVDDFVICFESESLIHLQSEIGSVDTPEGSKWYMHAGSGPLVLSHDGEVVVHYGSFYKSERLGGQRLRSDSLLSRQLHDNLAVFDPACRSEFVRREFRRHDNA